MDWDELVKEGGGATYETEHAFIWNLKRLIRDGYPNGLPIADLESEYSTYFIKAPLPQPNTFQADCQDWSQLFRKGLRFRRWFSVDTRKKVVKVLPVPEKDLRVYLRHNQYQAYKDTRDHVRRFDDWEERGLMKPLSDSEYESEEEDLDEHRNQEKEVDPVKRGLTLSLDTNKIPDGDLTDSGLSTTNTESSSIGSLPGSSSTSNSTGTKRSIIGKTATVDGLALRLKTGFGGAKPKPTTDPKQKAETKSLGQAPPKTPALKMLTHLTEQSSPGMRSNTSSGTTTSDSSSGSSTSDSDSDVSSISSDTESDPQDSSVPVPVPAKLLALIAKSRNLKPDTSAKVNAKRIPPPKTSRKDFNHGPPSKVRKICEQVPPKSTSQKNPKS